MVHCGTIVEGSLEVKFQIRQYGQMEKQRWEEPEKRRGEKRRGEKRREKITEKGVRKKNAGARKGRKVLIHYVFSNDLWLRRVEK